ncbi:SDR family NAD(P)-dependent oxidoreductase [Actinoplanes sp. NPDC089786]|uniref:SDR family NAD(P)-dependent oxidoreductase n=1 Tax=Actinoplanes sp. NPDC089786 TaxID=3155185 RepID=UPI0034334924
MAKTIVITGASNGIGAAAARRLTNAGHHVVIVGRSAQKTAAIAREIGADHHVADFSRLDDVRRLAAAVDARYAHVDVLANNAGAYFPEPTRTVDGFQATFQVNHLAPFLLTRLLMDKLITSRAAVIQTSSAGARMGRVDQDDFERDKNFNPRVAYATAKLDVTG